LILGGITAPGLQVIGDHGYSHRLKGILAKDHFLRSPTCISIIIQSKEIGIGVKTCSTVMRRFCFYLVYFIADCCIFLSVDPLKWWYALF
jgi:hypothetical protein